MGLQNVTAKKARDLRVPFASKVIFLVATLIFLFPGPCILVVHWFVPHVPQDVSPGLRMFVALLALPVALAGLVPVLFIESRRGD